MSDHDRQELNHPASQTEKTGRQESPTPTIEQRAERYWDAAHCSPFELRPLSLPRTPLTLFLVRLRLRPISENG